MERKSMLMSQSSLFITEIMNKQLFLKKGNRKLHKTIHNLNPSQLEICEYHKHLIFYEKGKNTNLLLKNILVFSPPVMNISARENQISSRYYTYIRSY